MNVSINVGEMKKCVYVFESLGKGKRHGRAGISGTGFVVVIVCLACMAA